MKNDSAEPKTKVLFIITKSNWGGAQKYVFELASGLDRTIFEPVVALGGDGELASKLQNSKIRTINLPSLGRDIKPLRDASSFRDLLRVLRDERPHVVHLNSSKIGILGSLAARITGVPKIIFTAHGWAFNEERSSLSRLIIKALYFVTIALCDTTIAVSKAVAKDAPAWGIRTKVVMIHPPLSDENKQMDKFSAREYLTKSTPALHGEDRLWVGIVAELHKNKGISYAIEAMRDTNLQKNTVLVVIGSGEEKNVLENQVRASGLEQSVFFLGFHQDAERFMKAFDIFLLPSITEAFGYVILEAGFAGLPVVASDVGGIPEIIDDGKTGILIQPRRHTLIRDMLNHLAESPALRDKLGNALREKIARSFSPEKVIIQTTKLYK